MSREIDALGDSVSRLGELVGTLDAAQLRASAYPSEWVVSDVLSHLGSGAVILHRRLDDVVAGTETPDDFAPSVWDRFNAKDPETQATDALQADRALLDALRSLPEDHRASFSFAMGPITLGFDQFVGLRLNEHALHTWDIEVTFDPHATLADDIASVVVDNLALIARFTGRAGDRRDRVAVQTDGPRRQFELSFSDGGVTLTATEAVAAPDLELPAEALIRLVYGRLDPDHTPAVRGTADLDALRVVFAGP